MVLLEKLNEHKGNHVEFVKAAIPILELMLETEPPAEREKIRKLIRMMNGELELPSWRDEFDDHPEWLERVQKGSREGWKVTAPTLRSKLTTMGYEDLPSTRSLDRHREKIK